MRIVMLIVVIVALASCSASTGELQNLTSGKIGCPANDIQISNSQTGMKTASWTAVCHGKTYLCAGDDMLRGVTCTPQS
jgi:hypothetical protein